MHARRHSALLFALALCCAAVSCTKSPVDADIRPAVEPLVLAFYYPWYGRADGPSGRWYHWVPGTERHASTNTPTLGWYDSNDTTVVRQHIRWAKAAGIDGFISSWWGPISFEDRPMSLLLTIAEQENFRITAILEHPWFFNDLRRDFGLLITRHGSRGAWLKVDGRPVVFVYDRVMGRFSADEFRRAFEGTNAFTIADTNDPVKSAAFDGVFAYGPVQDVQAYMRDLKANTEMHHAAGRIYAGATLPGYDDSVIRNPPRIMPRENGKLYSDMWAAAAPADWVTVTSWNEWHEGTEIEPSLEHGVRYLDFTRTLGSAWRAQK